MTAKKKQSKKVKPAKKSAKTGRKLVNVKVTSAELGAIRGLAKKYTKGNVSAWVRAASMGETPLAKKALTKKAA